MPDNPASDGPRPGDPVPGDPLLPDDLTIPVGPGGRPLRVAHLTTVDMSLALLLRTELEVDVAAGFEVYGLSAPGPYVPDVQAAGATHVPLDALTRAWDLARDAAAARELAATLRRLDLDVLHTHNPKTGVLGRLIGRAVGIPVVVNTCHGLWIRPGDPWPRRAFVLGAESVAARASHAELYQNATDRHTLARTVPAWRSRVVGNGTDLARFRPNPAARDRVRTELGVGDDELLVGGVGRQVAEKGIAEYREAARALAGKARFVWIGPEDRDKADAFRTGADPHVEHLGARSDMPDVYAALDLFVLPSHREGFSRSAMEAAATGVPMVLSDIRGCREIGTHGEHVLLVPPHDAPALTEAVDRMLTDPALRARLAADARTRALNEFDQRRVARTSIDTYRAVARRRGLGWGTRPPRPAVRPAADEAPPRTGEGTA
ncbi:glycosyltransferase [Yinghuangia sp. ASG 101]|uniref:glycosyltransferase n=1 Tax=Yinghuangia sp. ASG 101 TaxID=2896848 RepID=UPI001E2F7BDC|nr:glycosyltransferase [Yinghuangia sp. ASG 101]UGQ10594.1 glycosyltransferase [Yinghuangia sp. ASG 101]